MTENVSVSDFPEIRWNGHWIWVPEDKVELGSMFPGAPRPPRSDSYGLFRKTFTLDAVPERVPARITADSRYILYINGQEISRGPARSQPMRMLYDLVDLAPALKLGKNVIAVNAKVYARPNSFYIPPVGNNGLGKTGAVVFEADLGKNGWLVSDDTWLATRSHAWDMEGIDIGHGVPVEVLDARQLPAGWQTPEFNDSGWSSAQLLRAIHIGGFAHSQPPVHPYGPLYPRTIAQLGGAVVDPVGVQVELLQGPIDAAAPRPAHRVLASMKVPVIESSPLEKQFPIQVDLSAGSARLVVDFGRIVAGLVQLDIIAPAGTTIDMAYVEDPLSSAATGFRGPQNGARYITRGSEDTFESFDLNGLRYIYMVIHGTSGQVSMNRVAVREMIYPWMPGASFECSDQELNALYKAGIRTVNLNSFDSFTDCPTREQRAWVGDSVVHQMVHLTTNLDWQLAWHYLFLSNSPRSDGILPMSVGGDIEAGQGHTIPDWSLHWVHGVYNLYRFTGDKNKVKMYMPSVERVLRWYEPFQTSAGVLKDVTEWNLVDWAALFVEDTSSIITAIWARGLKEFIELASWLGESASQEWAEDLYAKAKAGYEVFWDEARGTYVDHIKDGLQQKPISQVAGALAVVSGLAPQERWARIMETVTGKDRLVVRSWTGGGQGEYSQEKIRKQHMGIYEADWDVEREVVIGEPFISYLVHDAVAEAGLANKLPELYRRWSQFLETGYDTIGECWGWGTHVHGWSCTVTKDLVFYTLGVTPAQPGYAAARIAPRLGGLEWVKGKVPTPFGLIEVEVNGSQVIVNSPVPFTFDMQGRPVQEYSAGKHVL